MKKYFFVFLVYILALPEFILAAKLPNVFVSAEKFYQGETVLARIENKDNNIKNLTGNFGFQKLNFFQINNSGDWFALASISPTAVVSRYNLRINFKEGQYKKTFSVIKTKFPVTELAVNDELKDKGYTPSQIVNNVKNIDNKDLYKTIDVFNKMVYFSESFGYPLEQIKNVGVFGAIRKTSKSYLRHLGIDLDAEENTNVLAINNGIVTFLGQTVDYGKILVIDHGIGIYSLYLHLNEFGVKNGDEVKKGQVIALSGNTGYSLAPHLHFSIKIKGESVDPLKFIETTKKILN